MGGCPSASAGALPGNPRSLESTPCPDLMVPRPTEGQGVLKEGQTTPCVVCPHTRCGGHTVCGPHTVHGGHTRGQKSPRQTDSEVAMGVWMHFG